LENTNTLKVPFADPTNVFEAVLQFVYFNELKVEATSLVSIALLAVQLEMDSLTVSAVGLV
jgi:hypothetical protein